MGAAEDFGTLLRQLKDRSGLSYGVLAKRAHLSASTLHRYCNGEAVPLDYAPVERLARVCKAAPEELVALHKGWVLADAARGKAEPPPIPAPVPAPDPQPEPEPEPEVGQEPHPGGESAPDPASGAGADPTAAEAAPDTEAPAPVARALRTRRRALLATATAVVLLAWGSAVVVGMGNDNGGSPSAGSAADAVDGRTGDASPDGSASPSARASASPSVSASGTGSASPSATATSASPAANSGAGGGGSKDATGVPVTAVVSGYTWDSPCSQHYLIDQEPGRVPPPPSEQLAPAWAAALGGVSAGGQRVAVTLQGTGSATVVLESMRVRVVSSSAPLAWNDYAMGDGCGGGVDTAGFKVDLDSAQPAVVPGKGQGDFPYKVSESDPEVFYVNAATAAHDVSWYLELNWSSGARHGTLRLDDSGSPFRSSANTGRPTYVYPNGTGGWVTPTGG
ncbi:helix-turn-helix domain-containing protein [Streptomyces sp. NPDC090306]|uniref:helix-turn-helix domain-containing protein n=1 Tax=Streptomyces sp. NPDC090306 TaxID=3365961 RepID=UPI00381914A8